MNRLFLLLVCVLLSAAAVGQQRFRVMEYNVENLFDTIPDESRDDREFLPAGSRGWTSGRYWAKIGKLSRVIAAVGEDVPPAIVALCEVENDTVLHHLLYRTSLRRWKYDYVISRSPDRRGIDVALLFRPNVFRPTGLSAIRIPYDTEKDERPTRDILHVTGRLVSGDTLDVLLCHFPSRSGGQLLTEDYRCRAARLLKAHADSLKFCRIRPAILMLGDFNDEYSDKSIADCLQATSAKNAKADSINTAGYYVLSAQKSAPDGVCGTYKWRGRWNQLDQIIVNGLLLRPEARLRTSWSDCRIVDFPFLLTEDKHHGGLKPHRTYNGPVYSGGFSDHLPMVVDFYF